MMRRRLALSILLALLLCAANLTSAQTNDVLGIYFDTAGTNDIATTDTPMQVIEAYLMIRNPSHDEGITGWECIVEAQTGPDSYVMVEWELNGQALNLGTAPAFLVGIGGAPLPWSEAVLLATATITVPEPGQEVNLYLHPFDPPTLNLNGYPRQVPAYVHGAGGGAVPLALSSGCEALPVARINPGELPPPVPVLTLTGNASFGLVNVGSTETATVILENTGMVTAGGLIQLEASGFRFGFTGGSYVLGPIWYHLEPGAAQSIDILFLPNGEGLHEGALLIEQCGVAAASLAISGTGGVPGCLIEPDDLDFGEVRLGQTASQVINITSIGSGPLEIDLISSCSDFQILGGTEFVLEPEENRQVTIRFAPTIPGLQQCTIYAGNVACVSVPCRGIGLEPDPDCAVSTAGFDFGEILTGTSEANVFTITNTGGNFLEGEVALTDGCEGFVLSEGAGPYSLGAGQTHEVVVEFMPLLPGEYTCEVETGSPCDNPVFTGSAREAITSCSVDPEILDFGDQFVNRYVQQEFTVTNTGDTTLQFHLSEECGYFWLGSSTDFELTPGQSRNVRVYFRAREPGDFTCTIDLGLAACGPVSCEGSATIHPDDLNEVGIFFEYDEIFHGPSTYTLELEETVTGYVVLGNLTEEGGLLGWQLCLDLDGDATWAGWEIAGEGAVNTDVPPCFEVNYPVPLPIANQILLATFQVTVLTPWSEIFLYTLPGSDPWLPDVPAFIPGDAPDQYLPMNYHWGSPHAGSINEDILEVVAGPPELNLAGASVVMSWHIPQAQIDGYHVFRRVDQSAPVRLTAHPLAPQSGRMTFTDHPDGIATGTSLFYSYAALRGGQEIARSSETMILWEGSASNAPRLTRLHPCYPNPFNPLTHLRFDLGTAGPVVLAIFDLNGHRIAILANEALAAGTHERLWEGRDDTGRRVASGTYYARLESQDGIKMRKMVLLK